MPLPIVGYAVGGFWVAFNTWLFTVAPALVTKVLIALGIGMVTYTGADYLVTNAETYILAQLGGVPAKAYAVLKIAGIDEGIRMVFAAASAYITIRTTMGAFSAYRARPDSFRA